jgi:hypothetical protein
LRKIFVQQILVLSEQGFAKVLEAVVGATGIELGYLKENPKYSILSTRSEVRFSKYFFTPCFSQLSNVIFILTNE